MTHFMSEHSWAKRPCISEATGGLPKIAQDFQPLSAHAPQMWVALLIILCMSVETSVRLLRWCDDRDASRLRLSSSLDRDLFTCTLIQNTAVSRDAGSSIASKSAYTWRQPVGSPVRCIYTSHNRFANPLANYTLQVYVQTMLLLCQQLDESNVFDSSNLWSNQGLTGQYLNTLYNLLSDGLANQLDYSCIE